MRESRPALSALVLAVEATVTTGNAASSAEGFLSISISSEPPREYSAQVSEHASNVWAALDNSANACCSRSLRHVIRHTLLAKLVLILFHRFFAMCTFFVGQRLRGPSPLHLGCVWVELRVFLAVNVECSNVSAMDISRHLCAVVRTGADRGQGRWGKWRCRRATSR